MLLPASAVNVNLLSAPRAYAKAARVFDAARFDTALLFLGVSLVVTMILKAPMFGRQPDAFSYLAADAVWKFIVVLLEAAVIAGASWLLGGKGAPDTTSSPIASTLVC